MNINNNTVTYCNTYNFTYHKVVSINTSCLEAHSGFYRLFMKGTLDAYAL